MCGIAGMIAHDVRRVPEDATVRIRSAIRYRGRDAEGAWSDGERVRLFHSRLAIIDPVSGGQPMEDGAQRYVIVFNGEIYNYRELRQEYARMGACFHTQSDTEVILEGFRLKGAEVCRDLNGMFAFAIWDKVEGTLFLARDRLGKKPLYWASLGGVFHFASSLGAFDGLPGWSRALSPAGLALFWVLGTFPEDTTVYEAAHALPPASWMRVAPGCNPETGRYWRLDFPRKSPARLGELLEEYETLLSDALRLRLRSDVPLALTFSGGVDSGTLAALCARRLGQPLKCFTIDYHTPDDPSEETVNARRVAEMLGLEWEYIHFDYRRQLLDGLEEAYGYYDQPCQQLPLVYAHRLYAAIKPHATVVLSGNGADELFTGYVGDERVYRNGLILKALSWLRPLLRSTSLSPYLRKPLHVAYGEVVVTQAEALMGGNGGAVRDKVRSLMDFAQACGAESALDLKMFVALKYTGFDSNFRLPDISGLASQVEVRSPFLDHRMVEFAARLPHQYKVGRLFSHMGNKYLPKQYYERWVQKELAWSRKKGMGWNLRWDKSIATDVRFEQTFALAYDALEASGLPAARFRQAWRAYQADVRRGVEFSPHAGAMMNGFMLGAWLRSRRGT